MKKFLTISLVSFFILFGLLSGNSHAADKIFKFEFSSFVSPQSKSTKLMDEWCRDIEKKTNGQVKITQHPGNTLTEQNQTYDSVVDGIVDIGFSATSYNPGKFPQMEAIELPLGLKTSVLLSKLANDYYDKFKPKEFKDSKVLFFTAIAGAAFHTKKPVKKLEDLAGMKIRCPGGPNVNWIKSIGAIPVVLPTGDTYDALSKGVVDGSVAAFEPLETLKWYEVAKFSTQSGAAISQVRYLVMNQAKWNSLPANLQKIVSDVSAEYNAKLAKLTDEVDQSVAKSVVAKGHTVIVLDAKEEQRWLTKVAPILDGYIKDKSGKGFPAAEQVKFCQDWVKRYSK
ncbi:MAG TPA: TRAP transporter substrate-binding protein [Syntrophorhabdaceae bacterium]|nr:TRAP transporter substrate-binding protein [Syntrophorhabdaceae bacterium]